MITEGQKGTELGGEAARARTGSNKSEDSTEEEREGVMDLGLGLGLPLTCSGGEHLAKLRSSYKATDSLRPDPS